MLKKRINKIKTKQKQRQKQMQIVNVNIHKPTRRQREGPTQPRRNILPTPQYIYTSQTDSLVPQVFNKQGQREYPSTLTEQINKSLDEKVNKLFSQYTKPAPIQQEQPDSYPVKFISPTTDLKPVLPSMYKNDKNPITPKIISQSRPKIYKSEPETLKTIIENPKTNIKKENLNTISSEYKSKEKLIENEENQLMQKEDKKNKIQNIRNTINNLENRIIELQENYEGESRSDKNKNTRQRNANLKKIKELQDELNNL